MPNKRAETRQDGGAAFLAARWAPGSSRRTAISAALGVSVFALGMLGCFGDPSGTKTLEGWEGLTYLAVAAGFAVLGAGVSTLGWCRVTREARKPQHSLRAGTGGQALAGGLYSILDSTYDAFVAIDADGAIVGWNRRAEETFGWSRAEVMGESVANMIIPERYRDRHQLALQRYRSAVGGPSENRLLEVSALRRDGSEFPIELSIIPTRLDESRAFGCFLRDISERKQTEHQLRTLAFYDALTGLPNRILFQARLRGALGQAKRSGHMMGLLFLNIDRFKQVNNTLGYSAGDQLLYEVGQRLRRHVRLSDFVARLDSHEPPDPISRLGGNEFAVAIAGISKPQDAARAAQRILDVLSEPFAIDGQELFTSASIGIATFPADGHDTETLLRKSSSAVCQASNLGGSSYAFYTNAMNVAVSKRLRLETQLRHALERQEFSLCYQPIYNAGSGRVTGAEALLRWTDPQTGPVSPLEFVPIAEEIGMMVSIGEWVLRTACAQSQAWHEAGFPAIRLAVNVSAVQLRHKTMVEMVARTLEETGFRPQRLELEITESAILQENRATLVALEKLRDMGIGLSLDDFGTGHSSLSYLRRFSFDRVKVDRSFVGDLMTNWNSATLTAAIIAMAHSIRLSVVGEGVETREQAGFLRERGCDELQGYLFSRPIPAEEFSRLLKDSERDSRSQASQDADTPS